MPLTPSRQRWVSRQSFDHSILLQTTLEVLLAHYEHNLSCFIVSLQFLMPWQCHQPAGDLLWRGCTFAGNTGQTQVFLRIQSMFPCITFPSRCPWRAVWQADLAGDSAPWGAALLRTCHSDGWGRHALPLHDNRSAMETWHIECQKGYKQQKQYWGGKSIWGRGHGAACSTFSHTEIGVHRLHVNWGF